MRPFTSLYICYLSFTFSNKKKCKFTINLKFNFQEFYLWLNQKLPVNSFLRYSICKGKQ